MPYKPKQASLISSLGQPIGQLSTQKMKMGKAPQILKKAAAMCKSKTAVFAGRLLVLAAHQHRRMTSVAVISDKIHALVLADRARLDCHKGLVMYKIENRHAVVHAVDMATDRLDQLAPFDQDSGHDGCPDWTLHPIFSADDNCYTDEYVDNDDGDVLLDACDADQEGQRSVMDVIRSNRKMEGLEFNMEDEIDQAADMFIRRFRQQLNKSF
uniref:Uncharacterized protein n=1 Tax=Avena sativa TaxID=4498 RepID=A0ACD5XUD7_AVESA